MKPFDTFGEYMFDLLFAPLKKGKRSVNQFFIFFKVVGRIFDGMKEDVFRVRDEANVASASAIMLPVHGQDRDMPRLVGEEIESYRTRLSMKGIISEWGGTCQGVLYALIALGYEHSYIEPVSVNDPEKWAEFIVYLGHGNNSAIKELVTIFNEIQKVKQGSSRLAYFVYIDNEPLNGELFLGAEISSYVSSLLNTAESIVLVRDREFQSNTLYGQIVASYTQLVPVQEDDLILVRDRTFESMLPFGLSITSYKEESVVQVGELFLIRDRIFEKDLHIKSLTTSYTEEKFIL